jgi:hypothetical protein
MWIGGHSIACGLEMGSSSERNTKLTCAILPWLAE